MLICNRIKIEVLLNFVLDNYQTSKNEPYQEKLINAVEQQSENIQISKKCLNSLYCDCDKLLEEDPTNTNIIEHLEYLDNILDRFIIEIELETKSLTFEKEFIQLIRKYSLDYDCNIPDRILFKSITDHIESLKNVLNLRDIHYDHKTDLIPIYDDNGKFVKNIQVPENM
jgi:sulfur relay (sulfurtransferase) DsrC/TusE family protein